MLAQDLGGAAFVTRVRVGMKQRDCDGLDSGFLQHLRSRDHAFFVERGPDGAARPHPLLDLNPQPPRHERRWLAVLQIVENRNPQPPHFEHVAEALGGDEPGARALQFDDRVRGYGRSVRKRRKRSRRHALLGDQFGNAFDDGPAKTVGSG